MDRKGLPEFIGDKEMERGNHEMFFCKDANLMAPKWIDNKSVHIVTSHIHSIVGKLERRKKEQAEKIKVDCHEIVRDYNKHMG